MNICGPLIRPADPVTLTLAAGNNNDVSFSALVSAVLVTSDAAGSTLTGIVNSAGNSNGLTVLLTNDNSGQLTIAHDSSASDTANRIYCPDNANLLVAPRQSVELFYLLRDTHWMVKAMPSNASGGVAGGNGQIQFNDSGVFGADPDFTWNAGANLLTLGSSTTPGTLSGAAPATATSNGVALNIRGGDGGSVSGNGGILDLIAGTPVDGNGALARLRGSSAAGTNRNGGNAILQGGAATGNGNGGDAFLIGGGTQTSGSGGNITVLAGPGGGVSGNGGTVNITGGAANGGSAAGAVTVAGGNANNGQGGSINITATNGAGTNQPGGNIVLTAGNPTGTGTQGTLQLVNMTATGAQTATFAATNKPGTATGTPVLWLRVVVAGTTYWIPLFSN